jgi:cell division transport system permease protein
MFKETSMDLMSVITRAQRGLREELRLYLVAVSSLAVAFLCLGSVLLALANLDAIAEHWGRSGRVTVYLADGARAEDVAQLRVVLESLREVTSVDVVTSEEARAEFLEQSEASEGFATLSAELFPASLEVGLVAGTESSRTQAIARRVAQLRGVSDVETYRGFFDRLEALLAAGRGMSAALALLVVLCVVAVIGNTIRLAVARRHREIEVMKLCGATNAFVRGPFVVEGAAQGFAASILALVVLGLCFTSLREHVDETLAALTGVPSVFLSPGVFFVLAFGGAVIGAASSALSLRRYLTV